MLTLVLTFLMKYRHKWLQYYPSGVKHQLTHSFYEIRIGSSQFNSIHFIQYFGRVAIVQLNDCGHTCHVTEMLL